MSDVATSGDAADAATGDDAADALAFACAQAMLARDRAARRLGITLVTAGPGRAELELIVDAEMVNGHAIAHGGVTFTLADTAFAYACNSRDVAHVALDANISFTAPARLGDRLRAVALERSLRGRTGVYDVTVTNQTSALVAVFRGTCYRIAGNVIDGPR